MASGTYNRQSPVA